MIQFISELLIVALAITVVFVFLKRIVVTGKEHEELLKRFQESEAKKEYYEELSIRYAAVADKLSQIVDKLMEKNVSRSEQSTRDVSKGS